VDNLPPRGLEKPVLIHKNCGYIAIDVDKNIFGTVYDADVSPYSDMGCG
jgi:hypothetical protein